MKYCESCGTPHECAAEAAAGPDPQVKIAQINADRDKYIARVGARMNTEELETAEDIAETEAAADVASAAAIAEVIVGTDTPEDTGETGAPIVIEAPEPEPDPGPDVEPPPDMHVTPPRETKRGGGYWDAYH